MEYLVCYDVNTQTPEGRKRLRRVAKTCGAFGQRVQWSVFECILDAAELELLQARLKRVMDADEDSLRIYRLLEPREKHLQVMGRQLEFDMHDPLVV